MSKNNQPLEVLKLKDDPTFSQLSVKLTDVYHQFVLYVQKQNYNLKEVQQALLRQHGLDISLACTTNPTDEGLHENLINWENIFDKELAKDNKLTLTNIKNMVLSFISSAEPPIELRGDSANIPLPLKQSQLSIYIEDNNFKEQLNALAENNISAFELLSKLIGNNSFEQGIEKNYFYGFNLSETQSLFEQEEL